MYELEVDISRLEQSYTEPVEPKEDRLKLRLEVDLEKGEEEIRQNAYNDFLEGTTPKAKKAFAKAKPVELPKVRTHRRVVYDSEDSDEI